MKKLNKSKILRNISSELINKSLKKNENLNFLNSFSENTYNKDQNFKNFTKLQEELFDEFYVNLNIF